MDSAVVWTFDEIRYLAHAPFPATIDNLLEFADREGVPAQVIAKLEEMKRENQSNGEDVVYRDLDDVFPECTSSMTMDDYEGDEF